MELGPVEPNNGADEALGRQGRATVSEAEAGDHVHQILPLDCEVRDTSGFQEELPVPSGYVRLPDEHSLPRMQAPGPDGVGDGRGVRPGEPPWSASMEPWIDEGIGPSLYL